MFLLVSLCHPVAFSDIDEAKVVSFLGVRTDRQGFGILTWKHVGTQKFMNMMQ